MIGLHRPCHSPPLQESRALCEACGCCRCRTLVDDAFNSERDFVRTGMCPWRTPHKRMKNETKTQTKQARSKRAMASPWVCVPRKRAAHTCGEAVGFVPARVMLTSVLPLVLGMCSMGTCQYAKTLARYYNIQRSCLRPCRCLNAFLEDDFQAAP
jgi:hypothetical protein